jgi:hypothetical protein
MRFFTANSLLGRAISKSICFKVPCPSTVNSQRMRCTQRRRSVVRHRISRMSNTIICRTVPPLKYSIPLSHRPRSKFINFVQNLRFLSFLYRIYKTILSYKTISWRIKNGRNGLEAPGTVRQIIIRYRKHSMICRTSCPPRLTRLKRSYLKTTQSTAETKVSRSGTG